MSMLQIFDKLGRFQMPDQTTLNSLEPGERARFAPVKSIARELATAERDLKDATDRMGTLIEAHDAAGKFLAKNYPPPTFRDLWLSSTTRPDKLAATRSK